MAGYETRTRRFSRAEYERLIELGVFQPEEEIELIGGQLMVAEPQGAAHYTAIVKTARALVTAFGPGWYVRMEGPIGLDDDSEPEPDIAVVPGDPDDYSRAHPSRPVLTVEVAEASLDADRQGKGRLCPRGPGGLLGAESGGPCAGGVPGAGARRRGAVRWSYSRREVLEASRQIAPLVAPGSSIPVSLLLP